MKNVLLILLLLLLISKHSEAQVLRFRASANSSIFMKEPGQPEVSHPMIETLSHKGSTDFKPELNLGAEIEIMAPVTTDFELGVELDYTKLSGYTETAPLYNFFLSRYNPLPDTYKYPDETLIYKTIIFNILGTARFYLFPVYEEVIFFTKLHGGIAFVGTDFTFQDPRYSVGYDVGVLYSQGTKSNEDPKEPAFTGGGGIGLTYMLSDRLDIYFDGTISITHSDIVNGVPNYDFLVYQGEETIRRTTGWAITTQVSLGIIFTTIPNRRLKSDNYTRTRQFHKRIF
jgi:hypothetical protein